MATTPNYKASTLTGDKYTRAMHVRISNPLGDVPSIEFSEEEVVNLPDRQLKLYAGTLNCKMDQENPAHIEIYTKLNELYTILREIRDTPPVLPEVPSAPPPYPQI